METMPPKSNRPSFGAFTPPAETVLESLDRSAFKGLSPEAAAEKLVAFYATRNDIRDITQKQKRVALRKILKDLAERKIELATMTAKDAADYRAYLSATVDLGPTAGGYDEDYCAHLVVQWNSVMNNVFGESEKVPGNADTLKMRGFEQRERKVDVLTDEDHEAMLRALPLKHFRHDHDREAFRVYLELQRASSARVGSIINGNLRACDIDWERQTVKFVHMKTMEKDEPHEALLTPRATVALRQWVDYLQRIGALRGPESPLLVDRKGRPIRYGFIWKNLAQTAKLAGLAKKVSSHVIRKSTLTHIAQVDPDFAGRQGGISQRILQRHYNQPTMDQLMKKRHLLPAAAFQPRTPQELAGWAMLEHQAGRLSRQELQEHLDHARRMLELPGQHESRPSPEVV